MFPLPFPGPTPMRKLRTYLARFLPLRYVPGQRQALPAAAQSKAGILRYWEGHTPHFITFIRREDGRFRFLNVSGAQKDITAHMDVFFREHCRFGWIRVLVLL